MKDFTEPPPNEPLPVAVLSGGVALGAYQMGVLEGLTAGGVEPLWLACTSIGAVNAAIFAGNPQERRFDRLQRYWQAASFDPPLLAASEPHWLAAMHGFAAALQVHVFGSPRLFKPRLPGLSPPATVPSLYDITPSRRLLEELVDFGRLNSGEVRVTLTLVEIATGLEVVFDTAQGETIGPDHILAACGFLPDFAPMEIGGRVLGDGGLCCNAPVHRVLADQSSLNQDLQCVLVDLYPADGPLPTSVIDGFERRMDLIFANQTRMALWSAEREHRLRQRLAECGDEATRANGREASCRSVEIVHLSYRSERGEAASEKVFDFSARSIERRADRGRLDAELALRHLASPSVPGAFVVNHIRQDLPGRPLTRPAAALTA